jgi:hypothetical protein
LTILGTAGTPDRAADETGVSSTGTIVSNHTSLPWR